MIRYWIADLQICNARVAISDYQIQGMTRDVRRFVDMLDVPERLQQLHQSHGVDIITLINMNVALDIPADTAAGNWPLNRVRCCDVTGPTLKLKRPEVDRMYSETVGAFYDVD